MVPMIWFVSLFYILGILSAADAIMTTRTAQGAVAWVVSLVSFPFFAVPAYLVFGRRRFVGTVQAYHENVEEIDALIKEYRENVSPFLVTAGEAPSWHRAIGHLSRFNLTLHNHVKLLIDGVATFDSVLKGVASAESYILFHFYMIHDDELGNRVKSALIERARAGVKVFVLYDEIGSKGLSKTYINDLIAAGVEVSGFKPTQGRRNRFQLNFRNHRKIVVVDGKYGWVGGHNVGDEYLGRNPKFSPWRDTHIRIEGPAVLQLQMTTLFDWYWATRQIPALNWTAVKSSQNQKIAVLATAPVRQIETASLFFVSALNAAAKRIWIAAPYFLPDEAVLKALQLAALRGVDVRILTTGKGDSLPVYLAAFDYIYALKDIGIKFYAYKPGFLHEKVMLVDDFYSTIGTHNFDNRSFRLNFEVAAITVDAGFASEVEAMLLKDFDHAEVIDPQSLEKRSTLWWLSVKLSRLLDPVL